MQLFLNMQLSGLVKYGLPAVMVSGASFIAGHWFRPKQHKIDVPENGLMVSAGNVKIKITDDSKGNIKASIKTD
jgi:hypothetical protein